MKTNVTVRIALTLILLIIVWSHTHWSVALAVTLLALQTEIVGISLKAIVNKINTPS